MPPHARALLGHLRRLAAPADSDAALLARWTERRDESAFAVLVARHGPMVLSVCRRVLGDEHTAEDAFQATFLVLARKASALRRPEALPSFLFGVALRLARKSRGPIRRRLVQTHPDVPEPADPHPHPLDALTGRELLALLDEEVARQPEVYRLPLLLCVMQGRTVEEAARLLGWSNGSLRGRLARGREKLRERLARRGLAMSVGALTLLAPAAVPEHLRAAALRNLAVPAAPAVSALAAAPALKLKAVCFALFVVIAAGLGASLPLLHGPNAETPAASPSAAPPAQAKGEPRTDRYGDPLPPGAVTRLGTLRYRAPGEIVALAFAPDGKTLAVSSRAGLFLFDAASGRRIKRLPTVANPAPGSRGTEDPLIFSPDGKRLISRGHKVVGSSLLPVVRVWELDSERKPREHDLGRWILWLGWSAQNEPLAIRGEEGAVHLHDLAAGRSRRFACKEPSKTPVGGLRPNPDVAYSPAGKVLAVADDKNSIHVWNTDTGRERCTLQAKGEGMHSLTFSPDGNRLVSITPKAVQLWDVTAAKALFTVDAVMYYGPVFSADGKILAILASWETIRLWDAETGRERGSTAGKGDYAAGIALSPDGKWLAAATRHGSTFHLWDVATGKQKPQPDGHTNRPWSTAFSPDGRRVVTGGRMDGTFRVWDTRTGEPLRRIKQPGMARECALSVDGRTLFASWSSGGLGIFDAATGQRQRILPLDDPQRPDTYQSVDSMHLTEDGKTLVAFSYCYTKKQAGPRYQDTLITGFDASTHKQLFQRRRPGLDLWNALSPDARILAVPHHDPNSRRPEIAGLGPMRLEDVRSGELLLTFSALKGQTWPLAFAPDGRLLAANNFYRPEPGKDGKPNPAVTTLHLWETATASEVLSLPAADFLRVGFSHDGRLLALSAPSQEIVVWDLLRGREHRRFKGFDAEVIDLAFSPDGRRLVSGLADSTLLIWDVGPYPAPVGKLDAEAAAKAWTDLASDDAPRAFWARGALASAPEETIALLKEHLHPARPADPKRLRQLLADLESEQFTVREKAQAALAELGDLAAPALRQTLADKPTLEARRRVQALLDRLRAPVKRPEVLRSLRAVAVLEDIGTPEARRLLEELAKGADGARLTREANESLHRLTLHRSSGR